MTRSPKLTLPRIIRFFWTDDCPDSACPHCGVLDERATLEYVDRAKRVNQARFR